MQHAAGINKSDRLLLQSVSGITKCDSYFKVISIISTKTAAKNKTKPKQNLERFKNLGFCKSNSLKEIKFKDKIYSSIVEVKNLKVDVEHAELQLNT